MSTTTQNSLTYTDYITACVRHVANKLRGEDVAVAVLQLISGILIYLVVAIALDHALALSWQVRTAMLMVAVSVATWHVVQRIAIPLVRKVNEWYVARTIDHVAPELADGMTTVLELERSRDDPAAALARPIVEDRVVRVLARTDVTERIGSDKLLRAWYLLAASVVLVCVGVLINSLFAQRSLMSSLARVLVPWVDVAYPTRTRIVDVRPGDDPELSKAVAGSDVQVSAIVEGAVPEAVYLYWSVDGGQTWQRVPMERPLTSLDPWRVTLEDVEQSFVYYLEGGDCRTKTYRFTVLPVPVVQAFEVHYEPPEYTGQRPYVSDLPDIEAVEGTRVTVIARLPEPVKRAELVLGPDKRRRIPMHRVPGKKDTVQASFDVTTDDVYRIWFTLESGATNPNPPVHQIKCLKDRPPVVRIVQPGRDLVDPPVPITGQIPIVVEASDDFGLRVVELVWDLPGQGGVQREILFDGLKERRSEGEFRFTLSADRFGLRPGEELVYWAEVVDNKRPGAQKAQSQKYRVKFVAVKPPEAVQQPEPEEEQKEEGKEQRSGQEERQDQGEKGEEAAGTQEDQQGESEQAEQRVEDPEQALEEIARFLEESEQQRAQEQQQEASGESMGEQEREGESEADRQPASEGGADQESAEQGGAEKQKGGTGENGQGEGESGKAENREGAAQPTKPEQAGGAEQQPGTEQQGPGGEEGGKAAEQGGSEPSQGGAAEQKTADKEEGKGEPGSSQGGGERGADEAAAPPQGGKTEPGKPTNRDLPNLPEGAGLTGTRTGDKGEDGGTAGGTEQGKPAPGEQAGPDSAEGEGAGAPTQERQPGGGEGKQGGSSPPGAGQGSKGQQPPKEPGAGSEPGRDQQGAGEGAGGAGKSQPSGQTGPSGGQQGANQLSQGKPGGAAGQSPGQGGGSQSKPGTGPQQGESSSRGQSGQGGQQAPGAGQPGGAKGAGGPSQKNGQPGKGSQGTPGGQGGQPTPTSQPGAGTPGSGGSQGQSPGGVAGQQQGGAPQGSGAAPVAGTGERPRRRAPGEHGAAGGGPGEGLGPRGAEGGGAGGQAEGGKGVRSPELVLKRLEDMLRNDQVDERLLKRLGWTRRDLERFVKYMKSRQIRQAPGRAGTPRSRLLTSGPGTGGSGEDAALDVGTAAPPTEYKELVEAYTRSLSTSGSTEE